MSFTTEAVFTLPGFHGRTHSAINVRADRSRRCLVDVQPARRAARARVSQLQLQPGRAVGMHAATRRISVITITPRWLSSEALVSASSPQPSARRSIREPNIHIPRAAALRRKDNLLHFAPLHRGEGCTESATLSRREEAKERRNQAIC